MGTDPHARVFERYVVKNPTVCPRCLRRLQEIEPRPIPPKWRDKKWVSDEERHLVPDNAEFDYPPRTDDVGREYACKKQVTCTHCGSVGRLYTLEIGDRRADGSVRPVPAARLTRLADRVLDRLEESGIYPNRDAMHELVRQAKRNPSTASRDFDILANATTFAIKRAYARDRATDSRAQGHDDTRTSPPDDVASAD